jgi:hypothetical protein
VRSGAALRSSAGDGTIRQDRLIAATSAFADAGKLLNDGDDDDGTAHAPKTDKDDPEKYAKALVRVAEHLPPISTASAGELAAALLMTGPELRLFFDSKTDAEGRCGRAELEVFLHEVTKAKAVVPIHQRDVSVRCFVGELCNRSKRDVRAPTAPTKPGSLLVARVRSLRGRLRRPAVCLLRLAFCCEGRTPSGSLLRSGSRRPHAERRSQS